MIQDQEIKPKEPRTLTNQPIKYTDLKPVSKEIYLIWEDAGFKYVVEKPSDKEITILFHIAQSKVKLFIRSYIGNITKLIVHRHIESILLLGYLLPDGYRIGRGLTIE